MRTEDEIKSRLQWLIAALDEAENQSEIMQVKLYAQIDFIKWLLQEENQ